MELIGELIKTRNIDPKRIYISGFSLGAEGTYDFIGRWPGYFACAVPLGGLGDTSKAFIIRRTPIWIFHGKDDKVIAASYDSLMYVRLKSVGGTPRYTEFEGVPHDCRPQAFSNMELWEWIFRQRNVKISHQEK